MQIGSEVKYIRHHAQEGMVQGVGRIKAYGLDPENRTIALIQDNERRGANGKPETFNVPVKAVNPTPDFIEAFTNLVPEVKALEDDANGRIRAIVEEANDKIRAMNNKVLGEPVDMDDDGQAGEGESA